MARVDRYVALLRGINVGGRHKLTMKALAGIFAEAGATDVETYVQSGNVVFAAARAVAEAVPARVAAAIAAEHGFGAPVVLVTADELRAIAAENPFLGAETGALHVAFLAETPPPAKVRALDPRRSPPDELAARGRAIYLHLPNGVARTKLTNAYLDATLGTVSTIRNWRTVLALTELAG